MYQNLTDKELLKLKEDWQDQFPNMPFDEPAVRIIYNIIMKQLQDYRNIRKEIPEEIAQLPLRPDECFKIQKDV